MINNILINCNNKLKITVNKYRDQKVSLKNLKIKINNQKEEIKNYRMISIHMLKHSKNSQLHSGLLYITYKNKRITQELKIKRYNNKIKC